MSSTNYKVQSNTEMLMLEMVRTLSSLESRIAALEAVIQFDGAAKPPLLGGERSYDDPDDPKPERQWGDDGRIDPWFLAWCYRQARRRMAP